MLKTFDLNPDLLRPIRKVDGRLVSYNGVRCAKVPLAVGESAHGRVFGCRIGICQGSRPFAG